MPICYLKGGSDHGTYIRASSVKLLKYYMPDDSIDHLRAILKKQGDFTKHFPLGLVAGECFLKLLGSMLNDIQHNFLDTSSTKRILKWRAIIQELFDIKFKVHFVMEHICTIAHAYFRQGAKSVVDSIDVQIANMKKKLAELEARRTSFLLHLLLMLFRIRPLLLVLFDLGLQH